MDRFEYHCPEHGLIVWHRRSDPDPPEVPESCPVRVERKRCGLPLRFALVIWTGSEAADDAGDSNTDAP
jgi:hypothetical protein